MSDALRRLHPLTDPAALQKEIRVHAERFNVVSMHVRSILVASPAGRLVTDLSLLDRAHIREVMVRSQILAEEAATLLELHDRAREAGGI